MNDKAACPVPSGEGAPPPRMRWHRVEPGYYTSGPYVLIRVGHHRWSLSQRGGELSRAIGRFQSASKARAAAIRDASTSDVSASSPFAPTPPPSGGAASPRVHAQPPKHVEPGDNSDTGGGS